MAKAPSRRRPSDYPLRAEDGYARYTRRQIDLVARLVQDQVQPLLERAKDRELLRGDGLAWRLDAAAPPPRFAGRTELTARLDVGQVLQCVRTDADGIWLTEFLLMLERLRRAVVSVLPQSPDGLLRYAREVDRFGVRALKRVSGIDIESEAAKAVTAGQVESWARQNADWITSLQTDYLDDIAEQVAEAVQRGTSTRDLSKLIRQRTGVAKRKADFLARDQVGTLNARITAEQHSALGIDEFVWTNSGDQRVRILHRNAPVGIAQVVYRYSLGGHPTEGLPGEPYNCRCTARPVIPRLQRRRRRAA